MLQKNVEIFGPKRFTAIVFADEAAPVSREMVNTLSCSAQACLHALFIQGHCFAGQEHFLSHSNGCSRCSCQGKQQAVDKEHVWRIEGYKLVSTHRLELIGTIDFCFRSIFASMSLSLDITSHSLIILD